MWYRWRAAKSDDPSSQGLLPRLRDRLQDELGAGEQSIAWLEYDLDSQIRFHSGLILLTNHRLLCVEPRTSADASGNDSGDGLTCRSWVLDGSQSLHLEEYTGIGTLQLLGEADCLASWRYTSARSAAARHLVECFTKSRLSAPTEAEPTSSNDAPLCPRCGAAIQIDAAGEPTCDCVRSKAPSEYLFRLARFARPRAGIVALGFALMLTSTAASLVPPYLTIPIIDKVLIPYGAGQPVNLRLLWWYLGGLAGAAVLAWLLGWVRTYVLAWVSERIAADLRTVTYTHLQRLSLEYFGGKRTGDLISRIGSDTDRLNIFLSVNLLDFANDVLMMLMTSVILMRIDLPLAVASLAPLPIIFWLIQRVRHRLRRAFTMSGRVWSEMTSVLADTIPGIRVVKAFAQEQREIDRFRRSNDRVLGVNDRVNTIWSFFGPIVVFLTDCGLLIIWAFGVWRVLQGHITVGVLQAFVAYIGRFYLRLESMSRMVAAIQRAGASAQRLFAILDQVPSVAEPAHPVQPRHLCGEIRFDHAAFQYGPRRVLEDVDLHIQPGEMIGLVGPSGSGKTTLVNLVCRFYDVTKGAILVDGVDIRSFAVEPYRRHIGIVLQEPFLFYGTIAENIAYGRPDASFEEIMAAARAARAHDFILRLPDGYDSVVGERGQGLSGGERQRISIARALLIDPRILILDEATSSVDTETEREIQLALDNLVRGRTTIAIAHRLSTLRQASRLVVLERGRIVGVGRHDELLETSEVYSRLYRAQLHMNDHESSSSGDQSVELTLPTSERSLERD